MATGSLFPRGRTGLIFLFAAFLLFSLISCTTNDGIVADEVTSGPVQDPLSAVSPESPFSEVEPQELDDIDLSPLFAPPTSRELALVQHAWDSRDLTVREWQVDTLGLTTDGEHLLMIVSHRVYNEYRHFGAVRFPRNFVRGGSFPVLVYCHGGFGGINVNCLDSFDQEMPSDIIKDNFIIVVTAYRGELLNANDLGVYYSEGEQDLFGGDVDDLIMLLSGTLEAVPEADPDRIVAYGRSRGAWETYMLTVRDRRVKAAVILYGATDMTLPSIQEEAEDLLMYGGQPSNAVIASMIQYGLIPFLQGRYTLQDLRIGIIQSSIVYFPERFTAMQIHHGTDDTTVPIEHSERLASVMKQFQGSPSCPMFEYYRYEGGVHDSESLVGYPARAESWLTSVINDNPDRFVIP